MATCPYCRLDARRRGGLTRDHVVPVYRGGTEHFDNIKLVCRQCNGDKADLTLNQWLNNLKHAGDFRASIIHEVAAEWDRYQKRKIRVARDRRMIARHAKAQGLRFEDLRLGEVVEVVPNDRRVAEAAAYRKRISASNDAARYDAWLNGVDASLLLKRVDNPRFE